MISNFSELNTELKNLKLVEYLSQWFVIAHKFNLPKYQNTPSKSTTLHPKLWPTPSKVFFLWVYLLPRSKKIANS